MKGHALPFFHRKLPHKALSLYREMPDKQLCPSSATFLIYLRYLFCFKNNPVFSRMNRLFAAKCHLPRNTASRVPPGIRNIGMFYPYRNHIIPAKIHRMGNIIGKGAVPVRTPSQIIAVTPDLTVFVNSVKGNLNFLSLPVRRNCKVRPIPADSSRGIPCTAGIFLLQRHFHRPVMGHHHFSKLILRKSPVPRFFQLPIMKLPIYKYLSFHPRNLPVLFASLFFALSGFSPPGFFLRSVLFSPVRGFPLSSFFLRPVLFSSRFLPPFGSFLFPVPSSVRFPPFYRYSQCRKNRKINFQFHFAINLTLH